MVLRRVFIFSTSGESVLVTMIVLLCVWSSETFDIGIAMTCRTICRFIGVCLIRESGSLDRVVVPLHFLCFGVRYTLPKRCHCRVEPVWMSCPKFSRPSGSTERSFTMLNVQRPGAFARLPHASW